MFLVDAGERDDIASRKKCSTCKICKAKAAGQIMAPLPQIQLVLPLGAFSRCVVDFGGPFLTKQGREKKRAKQYLCVYMPSFLYSTPGNCIWIGCRFIFKCILQNDKSKRACS